MTSLLYSQISELTNSTFDSFRRIIYNETGIFMKESKRILVSNRLRKRLMALQMKSFDEYLNYLTDKRKGKNELQHFINAVSTNETYFYRGDNQFDALKSIVLTDLLQKKKNLKIWSAGCSTGEEAYTIAMVLLDAVNIFSDFEFKIIATDINMEVIDKAKEGTYFGRTLKFIPQHFLQIYFEQVGDERYRICDEVKKYIIFRVHNLLYDEPPEYQLDIIFCRNVMIYFDKKTQKNLVDGTFARALSKTGFLFIGHSESLSAVSERFKYAHISKAPIYRKASIMEEKKRG
jgi:chemotaxis protein methyltransferase CheR